MTCALLPAFPAMSVVKTRSMIDLVPLAEWSPWTRSSAKRWSTSRDTYLFMRRKLYQWTRGRMGLYRSMGLTSAPKVNQRTCMRKASTKGLLSLWESSWVFLLLSITSKCFEEMTLQNNSANDIHGQIICQILHSEHHPIFRAFLQNLAKCLSLFHQARDQIHQMICAEAWIKDSSPGLP